MMTPTRAARPPNGGRLLLLALLEIEIVKTFKKILNSQWLRPFLLIVILPLLGVLIYLIARGQSMHERAVSDAKAQDSAFRDYVRSAASSPADDIAKLEDLHNRGVISDEEFQRAKAKALA